MIGDPEFVILKYQSWLDTAKFENKIFGSIVKEYLRPTNNYVPGIFPEMKSAVRRHTSWSVFARRFLTDSRIAIAIQLA
jgi:hypothetical protein